MVAPVRKVHFYAIEPADESKPCLFDAKNVLKTIDDLDREAGEAYATTGLFDRVLGLVHGHDQSHPMLSIWNIDTVNAPYFEHKGMISDYAFMEGEGVAEPAYAMFFGNDTMALLRPVSRSAGPSAIADYINKFTNVNCTFEALVDAGILKLLQRPAEDVISAKLHVKTRNLPLIKDASPDVEAALRAAVGPSASSEVTIIWKAALKSEKANWWARTRPVLRDLVANGVIDAFEHASVVMTGGHPVDLMKQHFTASVAVDLLPGEKHVKPEAAAEALLAAYNARRDDLGDARKLRSGN